MRCFENLVWVILYAINLLPFSIYLWEAALLSQYETRDYETLEVDLKYLEIFSLIILCFHSPFCFEKLETSEELQEW